MSCAILVLEQPWWDLSDDPDQTSVQHFLDGLARLDDLPIFYATFYDTSSFSLALQHLMSAQKLDDVEHMILNIAGHGAGKFLGSTHLKTIFDRIAQHGKGKVVGVMLDSCELGAQSEIIEAGMQNAKLKWVLSYNASVSWLKSMLITIRTLSEMASVEKSAKKEEFVAAFQRIFDAFNPNGRIDPNDDEEDAYCLSDTLAVFVSNGRYQAELLEPAQLWPDFEWDDGDEE